MKEKLNWSKKRLNLLSVVLMSTSLLPATAIHAEESDPAVEAEEMIEDTDLEDEEETGNEELPEEPEDSEDIEKAGWVKEGANWYYYVENVKQIGWQEIENSLYYMNADGAMQTGWQEINNKWYYMSASGSMQTRWKKIGNYWYYLNENGVMQVGWQKIGNDWYYMNDAGAMQTGYLVINGKMYFFKKDGAWDSSLTDLNKNPTPQEFVDTVSDEAVAIAEEHGLYASVIVAQASLETGYGASALSKAPNHNLFGIKGAYQGQSVYMYTQEDDGYGNMFTIQANFRKYPSYLESFQDYADKIVNGVSWNKDIYTGTWRKNTNNYSDATAALTGVYATDTSYYRKLNAVIRRFKLYELDGDTLVTDPSLPRGWQKVEDNWFYIGKNGYKHTGWQVINGFSYYMDSTGVMQTGFTESDGQTYYLNNSGAMQTGWVKENGTYYYMNSKGEMQTGWIEDNGRNYYMDDKGVIQTGWVQIDNRWYFFNENGDEQVSIPTAGVLNKHTAKRLYGPRRVETSIQVSREVYPDNSAKNVVLAGFKGEADALTGTLLAVAKDAPLLLVNNYEDIELELARLGAEKIYLLGGTQVISKDLEKQLEDAHYTVKRVAGDGRWETAAAIAQETTKKADHVFLTNDGQVSLADALAIGPVSGRDQTPILLTGRDALPEATRKALSEMNVQKVTIVGGETVISKKVQDTLEAQGIKVERIAGLDRYETAVEIAEKYFTSDQAIVTNDGKVSFADALMGGYLGAKADVPILLTSASQLSEHTGKYLKKSVDSGYVLGGETIIQTEIFTEIENIFKNNK